MLTAEKLGITPEEQIRNIHSEHQRDSAGFLINFDNFYTTHSAENRYWCEEIYRHLQANGHIAGAITQAFDPESSCSGRPLHQGHLPPLQDTGPVRRQLRSLRGHLPPGRTDRRGLGNLRRRPIQKESTHFFFTLPALEDMLRAWLDSDTLQPQVANKLRNGPMRACRNGTSAVTRPTSVSKSRGAG